MTYKIYKKILRSKEEKPKIVSYTSVSFRLNIEMKMIYSGSTRTVETSANSFIHIQVEFSGVP